MAHNAVLGTQEFGDKPIVDRTHPAVVMGKKAKTANGTIARGELAYADANGLVVPYSAGVPTLVLKGVLVESIDTAKEEVAAVMVHGTVVKANLSAAGAAVSQAQLDSLTDLGIWAL